MLNKRRSLSLVAILLVIYAAKAWHHTQPTHDTTSQPHEQVSQSSTNDISSQTDAYRVARYIQSHQTLPSIYISKREARQHGWNPSQGNLCKVLPGRVIGGDNFANREHRLPEQAGRHWHEADVNFNCGRRNSDRLLYSTDGLVYLTTDHYRSFTQVP